MFPVTASTKVWLSADLMAIRQFKIRYYSFRLTGRYSGPIKLKPGWFWSLTILFGEFSCSFRSKYNYNLKKRETINISPVSVSVAVLFGWLWAASCPEALGLDCWPLKSSYTVYTKKMYVQNRKNLGETEESTNMVIEMRVCEKVEMNSCVFKKNGSG